MVKFLPLLALLLFMGQAHAQQPEPEQEQKESIEVESIQKYIAPFYYDGRMVRDPFSAPEIAIPLKPGRVYGPFLPLQSYRLEDLSLKGIFWNIKTPKAIIRTPKGVSYHVGIKDYVGENFRYVAMIREKEVVIIQTIENQGQRYSTTKVLFLKNSRSQK